MCYLVGVLFLVLYLKNDKRLPAGRTEAFSDANNITNGAFLLVEDEYGRLKRWGLDQLKARLQSIQRASHREVQTYINDNKEGFKQFVKNTSDMFSDTFDPNTHTLNVLKMQQQWDLTSLICEKLKERDDTIVRWNEQYTNQVTTGWNLKAHEPRGTPCPLMRAV